MQRICKISRNGYNLMSEFICQTDGKRRRLKNTIVYVPEDIALSPIGRVYVGI